MKKILFAVFFTIIIYASIILISVPGVGLGNLLPVTILSSTSLPLLFFEDNLGLDYLVEHCFIFCTPTILGWIILLVLHGLVVFTLFKVLELCRSHA